MWMNFIQTVFFFQVLSLSVHKKDDINSKTLQICSFSPPRKGIQIPESVNFCLWNPESWARGSRIPDTSSTEKESGIKYLEWTPESKTVLNSFTWGDQVLNDFYQTDLLEASYIWRLPLYQQMKTVNMGRPILSSDHQVKLSLSAQKHQSPLKLFTQSEKTYTQYFKLYNTIYCIFKFPILSSIFFSFTLDSRGLLAH